MIHVRPPFNLMHCAIFSFYQEIPSGVSKIPENACQCQPYKIPVIKRIFDIILSLLALIILAPLMIIISLAIRLESKGPVFYKSKRVGSNLFIFLILEV